MIKVAPSILAADPLQMGPEAERMVQAGCDWLHVDICSESQLWPIAGERTPEAIRDFAGRASDDR